MCEYCKNKREISNGVFHKIHIEKCKMYGWGLNIIDCSCPPYAECCARKNKPNNKVHYNINYCPMCGKKLEDNNDKDK